MTSADPTSAYIEPGHPTHPSPPPEPTRRGAYTGDPLIDAAIEGYETAWPDRIWSEAPAEHRRVWCELMAVHFVEKTGPFAELPGRA